LLAANGPPILVECIGVAVHGTEPRLVWYDNGAQTVRYAFPGPSEEYAVEDVGPTNAAGTRLEVAIATDPSGRPHVAYFPYRAGPVYAVRDPVWKTDAVTALAGNRGALRIAKGPPGAVVLGTFDVGDNVLKVGFGRQEWSAQTLAAECDSTGTMDLAVDSAGTTAVVHTCRSGVELWTQTGIYPAGFRAACAALGTELCSKACACPRSGDECCMSAGSFNTCAGPASYCPAAWGPSFCGNATVDPALVFACHKAIPTMTCAPDGGVGALEPPDCTTLREQQEP
jgi:hypothetical protein